MEGGMRWGGVKTDFVIISNSLSSHDGLGSARRNASTPLGSVNSTNTLPCIEVNDGGKR